MAIDIKDAKEKLGKDKIDEIVQKEWKVADMPTEEELAQEEPSNPKARNNPNSRKNLIQYRKKTPEQKEKMIKNLKFVEKEEDVDPREILGDFSRLDELESFMPARDILKNRREQEQYYNYIKLILSDFDADELTASDLDDIVTLAVNKIIETRLLSGSAQNPMLVMEASPTIEKFRKFSEKIKSGLANRRVDRIDVKNKPKFSIVDLASQLDEQEKLDFEQRIKALEKAREEYVAPKRNEEGYLAEDE